MSVLGQHISCLHAFTKGGRSGWHTESIKLIAVNRYPSLDIQPARRAYYASVPHEQPPYPAQQHSRILPGKGAIDASSLSSHRRQSPSDFDIDRKLGDAQIETQRLPNANPRYGGEDQSIPSWLNDQYMVGTGTDRKRLSSSNGTSSNTTLATPAIGDNASQPTAPLDPARPYICRRGPCNKRNETQSFKDARGRRDHERRVHLPKNERRHVCNKCQERFLHSKDIRRHDDTVHSTGPPDQGCPVPRCSSILGRADNLRRHVKTLHPEWNSGHGESDSVTTSQYSDAIAPSTLSRPSTNSFTPSTLFTSRSSYQSEFPPLPSVRLRGSCE